MPAVRRLQLAGRQTAEPPDLTDHLVELRSIARNAEAAAELESIVMVADEAEPSLTDVAPLHDALRSEAWLSTPSAQTFRRSECANEIIVDTSVIVSGSFVIVMMKDLSIFSEWTGNFAR